MAERLAAPLAELEDVSLVRDGNRVLDHVSLQVPAHGITVVVGPSGSGKSTLLRLVNRLEVPSSGRVRVRGEDVATLDPLSLRRRIGMVFQRPTPLPGTALDNLRIADPELGRAEAEALARRVALPVGLLDRDASTLSGGEAQRMCVARALAAEPEALLADEPTSSVDESARREIEQLARRLADAGVPVVWVTHDLDQMRRLADHAIGVVGGTIAYCGDRPELAAAAVRDAGADSGG